MAPATQHPTHFWSFLWIRNIGNPENLRKSIPPNTSTLTALRTPLLSLQHVRAWEQCTPGLFYCMMLTGKQFRLIHLDSSSPEQSWTHQGTTEASWSLFLWTVGWWAPSRALTAGSDCSSPIWISAAMEGQAGSRGCGQTAGRDGISWAPHLRAPHKVFVWLKIQFCHWSGKRTILESFSSGKQSPVPCYRKIWVSPWLMGLWLHHNSEQQSSVAEAWPWAPTVGWPVWIHPQGRHRGHTH